MLRLQRIRSLGLTRLPRPTWCHGYATVAKGKKVYTSTPIFYVNAAPHIGHLYSMVLADTLNRYHKLRGDDATLSTGTDEHGLKIQQAATQAGKTPIALCDEVSSRFKDLAEAGNVQYDDFIRTTEPRHVKAVHALWDTLMAKGHIYKGKHEGWYSVSDEAFYADIQVTDGLDPRTKAPCKISIETGSSVEWSSEENYKFRLSAMGPLVKAWLQENPQAIQPVERYNEVLASLATPPADLSVSRPASRLQWGIPVPGDPSHTIYVWMDALTNYLAVTGYPQNNPQSLSYDGFWPAHTHLVGKDIIRFHSVYWPAFLIAAGLPPPKRILAHAHWTMDKAKMSKSRGNVADPHDLIALLGRDPARFYLVHDGGIANDADYAVDIAIRRYKKELAGQLGNLLSRSTSASLNPSATIPAPAITPDGAYPTVDATLHTAISSLPAIYAAHMEEGMPSRASSAVFAMLAEANRHFSSNAPWKLSTSPAEVARREQVLWWALESCRVAAILLQPIMPEKAAEILSALSIPLEERSWEHAAITTGWSNGTFRPSLPQAPPIFPRLS